MLKLRAVSGVTSVIKRTRVWITGGFWVCQGTSFASRCIFGVTVRTLRFKYLKITEGEYEETDHGIIDGSLPCGRGRRGGWRHKLP